MCTRRGERERGLEVKIKRRRWGRRREERKVYAVTIKSLARGE